MCHLVNIFVYAAKKDMVNFDSHQITLLLNELSLGNKVAFDQLMPLVYEELRRMAKRFMNKQQGDHTLQTTELIHEAYLKLADGKEKEWQNRSHFFGVASQAMRHILVDYARAKQSKKRGGIRHQVTLDENAFISKDSSADVVSLNEALDKLSELDERKVRVVEMKFFGGLTMEEIAEVLSISQETAKRDWKFARTWLLRELT
jgi:RNA polymerase sigma-70 factor, ECF subfamily